jgi:hypothetical protein
MAPDEMQTIVKAELVGMPRVRGNVSQGVLRSTYQMLREHSLKTGHGSAETVFEQAITLVRKDDPGFEPVIV